MPGLNVDGGGGANSVGKDAQQHGSRNNEGNQFLTGQVGLFLEKDETQHNTVRLAQSLPRVWSAFMPKSYFREDPHLLQPAQNPLQDLTGAPENRLHVQRRQVQ